MEDIDDPVIINYEVPSIDPDSDLNKSSSTKNQ